MDRPRYHPRSRYDWMNEGRKGASPWHFGETGETASLAVHQKEPRNGERPQGYAREVSGQWKVVHLVNANAIATAEMMQTGIPTI